MEYHKHLIKIANTISIKSRDYTIIFVRSKCFSSVRVNKSFHKNNAILHKPDHTILQYNINYAINMT